MIGPRFGLARMTTRGVLQVMGSWKMSCVRLSSSGRTVGEGSQGSWGLESEESVDLRTPCSFFASWDIVV